MIKRDDLIRYLDQYLNVAGFEDYGPQGLQVEGKEKINRIACGVSASAQLFQEAIKRGADLIVVHHGILWDRESRVVKGSFKNRLQLLLDGEITLLAYHLCLDKHPEVGNNAVAARKFGLRDVSELGELGLQGAVPEAELNHLLARIRNVYRSEPLVFPYGPRRINRVGICSGAAPDEITRAIDAGLDAYITGEASESTLHLAKEGKINFIAAGHYATEKLGVRALARHIRDKFNLEVRFIHIPNPV